MYSVATPAHLEPTEMTTRTGTNRYGEEITVAVGDRVGFKADIEQAGKVLRFERQFIVVRSYDNETDQPIENMLLINDIWKD